MKNKDNGGYTLLLFQIRKISWFFSDKFDTKSLSDKFDM